MVAFVDEHRDEYGVEVQTTTPTGLRRSARGHVLRHTFGTHAAMFGVNPWQLQTWMGHKRIDETMIYVHVADAHEWSEPVHEAACSEMDPDRRIIAMLGARGSLVAAVASTETK